MPGCISPPSSGPGPRGVGPYGEPAWPPLNIISTGRSAGSGAGLGSMGGIVPSSTNSSGVVGQLVGPVSRSMSSWSRWRATRSAGFWSPRPWTCRPPKSSKPGPHASEEDGFRDHQQRLGMEECRAWTKAPILRTFQVQLVALTSPLLAVPDGVFAIPRHLGTATVNRGHVPSASAGCRARLDGRPRRLGATQGGSDTW
jgi:hypothetical protein